VFLERKKLALSRQKAPQEDAEEEAQEAAQEDSLGAPAEVTLRHERAGAAAHRFPL
jgi:hypothetical protein